MNGFQASQPMKIHYDNFALPRHAAIWSYIDLTGFLLYFSIYSIAFVIEYDEVLSAYKDSKIRKEAYLEEFSSREFYGQVLAVEFGVMVVISLLLLASAFAARRNRKLELTFHTVYSLVQVPLGIILGITCSQAIYHSSEDSFYYIGILPGIVSCLFPLLFLGRYLTTKYKTTE